MIISNVAKLIQGRPLAKVGPDSKVREACKIMCQLDVRAVLVLDGPHLVGLLSERDVIRKCVCADRHTGETEVVEVMTRDPVAIDDQDDLAHALEIMSEGRFHHIPVLRDGVPVGLLSSDDIPEEYRMLLERFKAMRSG
jgi:CBS domain-containing protein